MLCNFCLPNELGGLGWSKADFDRTDLDTINIVYNEAVKRSKENEERMSGKSEQKKLPTDFKLNWGD